MPVPRWVADNYGRENSANEVSLERDSEIGVAVPLLAVGAMMTANRRKGNVMSMGLLGIVLGGLAIAFPNSLIGVCQTPTMICNTVMKPALTVLGSLVIVGSIGAIVLSRKTVN